LFTLAQEAGSPIAKLSYPV